MSICKTRRQHLIETMKSARIQAAVFTPSSDYRYLTGSTRQPAQRIAALVVTTEHAALLLPGFEVKNEPELEDELTILPYSDSDHADQLLAGLLPSSGTIAVGSEMRSGLLLSLQHQLPNLTWCGADAILAPLRRRKDPFEIEIIETAQHMAERALVRLIEESSFVGKTEREIAARLMELRLEEGFDSVGSGIVASGPNTALPHHVNGGRIVREGDALMFDIGGTYKGYHADFTRTFFIGRPSEEFIHVYQTVLDAHMAGKLAARPGVPAFAADQAARAVIEAAGYGPYFTHRLGHGIGLDIHEPPFIAGSNSLPLETGNVFSCEPGIYLPGRFGVRIEDLLVLEENGPRSLNLLSKELRCLES